jgi:histone-lysine N-methyltransferase SETMAR
MYHVLSTRCSQKVPEFFDIDGLVHREFIAPGQSVTGHFYMQVLQRLHNAFWRKWQGQWFLHHDNAPSNTSEQFLAEKNIPVITQPPYSPDLAPSDFWLFPTLKIGLLWQNF